MKHKENFKIALAVHFWKLAYRLVPSSRPSVHSPPAQKNRTEKSTICHDRVLMRMRVTLLFQSL